MSFDIDSWFPNFELFVFILAPIIMLIMFVSIAIMMFLARKKKEKMTFSEMIGYVPIIFFFFPLYEIGEYLYGTRETIVDRLFTFHFPYMMYIILLTGLGQVVSLLFEPVKGEKK